jgi:regulation of enolase protein 1 (concanavalin A-like superfamily)
MSPTRRNFLEQAAGVALAAHATTTIAAGEAASPRTGGDLLSRMSWLNPPAAEHYGDGVLKVRSKGKTDFWRKTFYGYVTDNGHFLHLPMLGEFTMQARVIGDYATLYDQAGLMVRLDEKHWMKCGSEFVDGKRWASVVFTHDFSDWSTMEDVSQTGAVWWRVVRRKDSIEAQCSKDGEKFLTIRQGYFPADVQVMAGVMCAAPEGAGFDAAFDQLTIKSA